MKTKTRENIRVSSAFLIIISIIVNQSWCYTYGKVKDCYIVDTDIAQQCRPRTLANMVRSIRPNVTSQCVYDQDICFDSYTRMEDANDLCRTCGQFVVTPEKMTDGMEATYWASESEYYDKNITRKPVNVTFLFHKEMTVQSISIQFRTQSPQSMTIERLTIDDEWKPYVIFSQTCNSRYGMYDFKDIRWPIFTAENATDAYCTRQYAETIRYENEKYSYHTLHKSRVNTRVSHEKLRKYATVKGIRFSMQEMKANPAYNDFRARRQFYGISEINIAGHCYCRGHANLCTLMGDVYFCHCEHKTTGKNCELCREGFNDRPAMAANDTNANDCIGCQCNGHSTRCDFNETLYNKTGSGSDCTKYCGDQTMGINCEKCLPNHYRYTGIENPKDACTPCLCEARNSLKCDIITGKCTCKEGADGDRCNRCKTDYFDKPIVGCEKCNCSEAGSVAEKCNDNGLCLCKNKVDDTVGNCDKCIPTYFGLSTDLIDGCLPCYCSMHGIGGPNMCKSASGFYKKKISSTFPDSNDLDGWRLAVDEVIKPLNYGLSNVGSSLKVVEYNESGEYFFIAPSKYLGDQRRSFYKSVTISVDVKYDQSLLVIFESGMDRMQVALNVGPNRELARLHFNSTSLHYSVIDIQKAMANLTAIKIQAGSFHYPVILKEFTMETSDNIVGSEIDNWVENCTCQKEYTGLSCEKCVETYYRNELGKCVPCQCNGHAVKCDQNTGECTNCMHDTTGHNCDKCKPGFYGDGRDGTIDDCKPCNCKNNDGTCTVDKNGEVICLNCNAYYAGIKCGECAAGSYGNPNGTAFDSTPCKPCDCNGNSYNNSILPCDRRTGICLECFDSTDGDKCEYCDFGYYNNRPGLGCLDCNCFDNGSIPMYDNFNEDTRDCNKNGQCTCFPNVEGMRCDKCLLHFYDIGSQKGCQACNCNDTGTNTTDPNMSKCREPDGQCNCKKGVEGMSCDKCLENFYDFSYSGCTPCNCHSGGSSKLQCDMHTGQCDCKPGYVNRECSKCNENSYNTSGGCQPCEVCYSEVENLVNKIRKNISDFSNMIEDISNNPQSLNDTSFKPKLNAINESLMELYETAMKLNFSFMSTIDEINRNISKFPNIFAVHLKRVNIVIKLVEEYHNKSINTMTDINRQNVVLNITEGLLDSSKDRLQQAEKLIRDSSQQNDELTKLAAEARVLSDDLLKIVRDIERVGKDTEKSAEEAKEKANKFPNQSEEFKKKLDTLEIELREVKSKYKKTKMNLDDISDKVKQWKTRSVDLLKRYREFAANIPSVENDLDKRYEDLKTELEGLQKDYQTIKDDFTKTSDMHLIAYNKTLKADMDVLLISKYFDEYLSELYNISKHVNTSVDTIVKMVESAMETMEKLKNFDAEVQEGKEKARMASELQPEIIKMLNNAEKNTNISSQRVNESRAISQKALSLNENTTENTKQLNDTTVNIIKEIDNWNKTLHNVDANLKKVTLDADRTTTAVTDTKTIHNDNNRTYDRLFAVMKTTKENLDNITNTEIEIKKLIEIIEKSLNDIANDRNLDETTIKNLEDRLAAINKTIEEKKVFEGIYDVDKVITTAEDLIKEYDNSIDDLTSDVYVLREMNATLPDNCGRFNATVRKEILRKLGKP